MLRIAFALDGICLNSRFSDLTGVAFVSSCVARSRQTPATSWAKPGQFNNELSHFLTFASSTADDASFFGVFFTGFSDLIDTGFSDLIDEYKEGPSIGR